MKEHKSVFENQKDFASGENGTESVASTSGDNYKRFLEFGRGCLGLKNAFMLLGKEFFVDLADLKLRI